MVVILHRGHTCPHQENSWSALTCFSSKFGVETDLRLSDDGVIYCTHDSSMERLFQKTDLVEETGSDDLDLLGIVRLEKLLDYYQSEKTPQLINLELKIPDGTTASPALIDELWKQLRRYPELHSSLLISSFDQEMLRLLILNPLNLRLGLITKDLIDYNVLKEWHEAGITDFVIDKTLYFDLDLRIFNSPIQLSLFTFYDSTKYHHLQKHIITDIEYHQRKINLICDSLLPDEDIVVAF